MAAQQCMSCAGLFSAEELSAIRRCIELGFGRDQGVLALISLQWDLDRAVASLLRPSGVEAGARLVGLLHRVAPARPSAAQPGLVPALCAGSTALLAAQADAGQALGAGSTAPGAGSPAPPAAQADAGQALGGSTGGGAGTGGDGSSSQREATPDEFVFRRDFPPGDCIPNFWGSEEEAESLQPGVGGGNRGERSAGVGDVGGDGQRLGGGADDGSRRRRFADFRLKDCPALAHGTVPPQASGHSRRW